jgi:hypothetical protein
MVEASRDTYHDMMSNPLNDITCNIALASYLQIISYASGTNILCILFLIPIASGTNGWFAFVLRRDTRDMMSYLVKNGISCNNPVFLLSTNYPKYRQIRKKNSPSHVASFSTLPF